MFYFTESHVLLQLQCTNLVNVRVFVKLEIYDKIGRYFVNYKDAVGFR